MRISDWSSDVCSSDLADAGLLDAVFVELGARLHQHALPRVEIRLGEVDHLLARVGNRDLAERNVETLRLARQDLRERTVHQHHPVESRAVGHIRRQAVLEARSEEHTSELQSLMRISYAVFCLKKKNTKNK